MAVLRLAAYLGNFWLSRANIKSPGWRIQGHYTLRLGFITHSLALVDRGMGGSSAAE